MAKDRDIPCEFYICKGECSKGREASHTGYCQKCGKYSPRSKVHPVDTRKKKRDVLEKIEY